MATIHSTAIVDPKAELGEGVEIGPYSIVGPMVKLGDGTVLKSHVNIDGNTRIGANCTIWPFASIGTLTQDLKYKGGNPGVVIGDRTTLREYTTVNTATFDGDDTIVGADCHFMAYAHIAHDCIVGNNVIMANAATLAGHVIVEDEAIIGGLTGIHQEVRIGRGCIIGGCSKAVKDIPPYMTADGNPLRVRGVNVIGLKRRGWDSEAIKELRGIYKILYIENKNISDSVKVIEAEYASSAHRDHLLAFIRDTQRGITL